MGAASVGVGWDCLNWKFHGGLGGIIASWVISPVASGLIGLIIYLITHHTIIKPKFGGNPRRNAMIGQPILFTGQTFVIVFLILLKAGTQEVKNLCCFLNLRTLGFKKKTNDVIIAYVIIIA